MLVLNRRRPGLLAVLALMVVPAFAAAAPPPEKLSSAVTTRELWHRSSDQMLAGDFSEAAKTLARLQKDHPGDPLLNDVIGWIQSANQLAESRERLRTRIFEKHAAKAREQAEEKELLKALGEVYRASQYAVDKQAFLSEAWIEALVKASVEKAATHRKASEWRDAFQFYETLRLLFEDNADYKARSRECRQHAHFELFFTKKGEWKKALAEINAGVVEEVLARISQEYVREVDFRKATVSGLENLVLLARTRKLDQVFPTLGDPDVVGNFVDRVEREIGRVNNRQRFDYRDASGVFDRVLKISKESVALPENVLVDEFLAGFMELLDDFTSVIWPSDVDDFTKHTRGEFVGVGIQITKEPGGHIRVESPLEDTPAYDAGISPGDMITAIDGRGTEDIDVNDAVNMITGQPGTRVTLTIKSLDGKARDVTLVRNRIKLVTVRGIGRNANGDWNYMIDPERRIAYLRIGSFMERTVEDLRAVLEKLQQEGCKGLILDLRFNPGGLLRSAVDTCNLFMDEDEPIVMTKGRSGRPDMEITAKSGPGFRGLPLIILVNEYSASASEIVAGALSGRGRACIVGTRTYGKGSVQNLIPIEDNAAYLKLTTQYYYVPSGIPEGDWRCLHREEGAKVWGVDPDIKIETFPYEVRKVLNLRRKVDVLKGKGRDSIPEEVFERAPATRPAEGDDEAEVEEDDSKLDDAPDTDPQLLTALCVMRIKLLSNQPWTHAPRVAARDPLDRTK